MSEELLQEETTMADLEEHFDDANPWNVVQSYMENKTVLPVKVEGIVNGGAIAMVEGTDGIHWGEPRIVLEPRPESGWEDRLNRSCCLWRGGLCHLWYTGQSNGSSRIGHAVSKDGIDQVHHHIHGVIFCFVFQFRHKNRFLIYLNVRNIFQLAL